MGLARSRGVCYLEMVIKAQNVRLFDVFILGPFMIWAGMQLKGDAARSAMIAAGAGTIAYNWRNYEKVKRLEGV